MLAYIVIIITLIIIPIILTIPLLRCPQVGPHALLKSILKRSNAGISTVASLVRDRPGPACFQACLDSLWLAGVAFDFPKLSYVTKPSERIRVRWDHETDWRVCDYRDFESVAQTAVSYNLSGKDAFMMDHRIDGRSLFPAMGHVYTAWQVSLCLCLIFSYVCVCLCLCLCNR
jgi:hypothetical protein